MLPLRPSVRHVLNRVGIVVHFMFLRARRIENECYLVHLIEVDVDLQMR